MLISQFFKNQDVFITGGSGFLGKALIEKLLRSCPDVGRVFVLLRSKKGKNIDDRLRDILNSRLFNRLRLEQPQTFKKVIAISGDCSELRLGLMPEDLKRLENVSIIFHSAASVRFDDPLRKAILLNTRGTHELIKIAETLKNLKVFVHISTTYCNPDKSIVEEKVYPPYADWRTTIKVAETYDINILNILNKKYGDDQPNTYTFTKSLSEQIINDYKDKLPVIIFRPSIVISTIEEPEAGWIDNFNGPIGMLIACGFGIMRTNYAEPDIVADFMPVDVVIRALIVAAYKRGLQTMRGTIQEELEVINCASANSAVNLTNAEIVELGKELVYKNPLERTLWVPGGGITRCYYWNFIKHCLLHILPAIFVDIGLKIAKKKPMLLKLQRRIYEASVALHYFMVQSWDFRNSKFFALEEEIPKLEIDKFGFMRHVNDFDSKKYFDTALRGAKIHLLKEAPESSEGARKRFEILKALHFFVQLIGGLLIVRFFFRLIYFHTAH